MVTALEHARHQSNGQCKDCKFTSQHAASNMSAASEQGGESVDLGLGVRWSNAWQFAANQHLAGDILLQVFLGHLHHNTQMLTGCLKTS